MTNSSQRMQEARVSCWPLAPLQWGSFMVQSVCLLKAVVLGASPWVGCPRV